MIIIDELGYELIPR